MSVLIYKSSSSIFPLPQERQRPADTCGPWARRYPTAVLGRPGRRWQDGAGKAGTYLICCFHLVQGLGQRGLVDKALVAWVISWLPAPRQTVLCAPLLPSLCQAGFSGIFRQAVLSLIITIIGVLAVINIYYWLVTGMAGICSALCAGQGGWDLVQRPQPWI